MKETDQLMKTIELFYGYQTPAGYYNHGKKVADQPLNFKSPKSIKACSGR
jgi:hypothetical protein